MDEYVCLTVLSNPGESQADFAARLSRLWTHFLRTRKADFERVYAETTTFEQDGSRLTRRYLAGADVLGVLDAELTAAGVAFLPVAADDLYSKYEATSPEWMQIEH